MPIKLENYKERLIDKTIELYLKTFKAIQIVGPKWCGKTWTSMHHGNSIVRLTDIEKRKLAILNPKLILNENIPEVIDEWQLVPELWDAINIIQADERGRISERIDVPLFDYDSFHEAILNAFIHNKWLTLNAPQISIFTNRIEILSHGGLTIDQDEEGFYSGSSIPVNEVLASIFLQLRISERSGRGVPKIVAAYGKDSIKIEKNRIIVTIPFKKIGVNGFEIVSNKVSNKVTNKTEKKILELMRDNPNITIQQIMVKTALSEPGVKKNLKKLKDKKIIKRIGSNKTGYWDVVDKS